MSDWYLVATDGTEHKARFIQATRADAVRMKWTKGLLWSKEVRNISRSTYKLIDEGHNLGRYLISQISIFSGEIRILSI